MAKQADIGLFEARIEDLVRQAENRYETALGDFLSPGEAARARMFLRTLHSDAIPVFFGGYGGSERTRLLVLPAYMETEEPLDGNNFRTVYPGLAASAVTAVKIRGSGYRKLSHRDYMGSVLALGIERDVIGDIVTEGDFSALVFCDPKIAAYILQELHKIGTDAVKVESVDIPADFRVERQFETIRDTVASARLDCIVAALAGLAREKAQNVIRADEVEVDYLTENRVDRVVSVGSVITVRHVGKFILRSTEEQTKKGRYRLVADKYI